MKKRFKLIFLSTIILSSNVFALSWNQVVSLAERNSNELAAAQKQLESTEWSYRKSFSTMLPQVSANAGASGTELGTTSTYSYGLSASQYLFQGLSDIYGVQSAYVDVKYQKANLQLAQADFFYSLRSAFLDLLTAQEKVKLLEQILSQRKENTRLVQLRYDSGKEDKGNLMQTKANQKQAEYDLSSAKRDIKLARLKLSQLIQQEVQTVEAVESSLQKTAEVDLEQSLKTNPSYIMAQCQEESAEIAQRNTISDFLPTLSLRGTYSKSGSSWPPDTSSKSWSLSLSYSLFPGGSNLASRIIYDLKLAQAKEEFAVAVKSLQYSLADTYEGYNDAVEALGVAKVSEAAAKERAVIVQAKYLNGLTTYDEWDRVQSTYVQAQKSVLSYQKSTLIAEALWHKTIGGYVK